MSEGPSWAHGDAVRAAPTSRVVDAPVGTQVSTASLGDLISRNGQKEKGKEAPSQSREALGRPANTLGSLSPLSRSLFCG